MNATLIHFDREDGTSCLSPVLVLALYVLSLIRTCTVVINVLLTVSLNLTVAVTSIDNQKSERAIGRSVVET